MIKNLLSPLKNSRGSAIMFSMFVLSLLMFIAMEVSKDTVVEYQGSSNNVKRVQAYYAAKSCTDLSLLRIKAFQQARMIAKQLPDPSMLDMIWTFPLSWPISAPAGVSESDKDAIKKTVNASNIKHQFSSQITSGSKKIDINDLASSSEAVREKTKKQIMDFFQQRLLLNDEWAQKYRSFQFQNLINHLADWIDADTTSQLGGDEGGYYSDRRSLFIPPNQPFKTLEELHMVRDMTDEIFDVLAPIITIYGTKGINVNYADKEFLMALDRRVTPEAADLIIKRRTDPSQGGLFKDKKDFMGFIAQFGIGEDEFDDGIALYFDQEINFTISCIGAVGRITREIRSEVFDFRAVESRLVANYAEDDDPNKKQCANLEGDDKHKCLCADKTDPAENKKCIDSQKAADTAATKQDQGQSAPPEPGPPYVIFQDVN